MRKLWLISLLVACSISAASAWAAQRRVSLHLADENVPTFLAALEQRLNLGVDMDMLADFLLDTPVGEEYAATIPVRYKGRPLAMYVKASRKRARSCDLSFETESEALGDALKAEVTRYASPSAP